MLIYISALFLQRMIFALIICSVIIFVLLLWKKFGGKNSLNPQGNVLLITAHPDDECMFFSPTLLSLQQQQAVRVHLLCLSEGTHTQDEYITSWRVKYKVPFLFLYHSFH